jgi:hypothetical protein
MQATSTTTPAAAHAADGRGSDRRGGCSKKT